MTPSFLAREVWEGIRGNLSMVLSIVLVSFVSLSFVSVASLLQIQIGNLKDYWFDKSQIAIHLCNDFESEIICPGGAVTQAEQIAVASQLKSPVLEPYIETYYFENQNEVYQRLLNDSGDFSAAQYLRPEQLNAIYWVSLENPEQADLVVEAFQAQPGVAVVADQRSYFDPIIGLLNSATLAAGAIAAVMLFSSVLLTTTTVRLSAFARRREIGIMRLVGASRASIQLPFILEGLFASLVGGSLALGLSGFLVTNYLTDTLATEIDFVRLVSVSDVFSVAPYVLGLGAILAVLASGISTFRHLRI